MLHTRADPPVPPMLSQTEQPSNLSPNLPRNPVQRPHDPIRERIRKFEEDVMPMEKRATLLSENVYAFALAFPRFSQSCPPLPP